MERKIIWPDKARRQLFKVYKYILKDSFQNAEKVRKDIFTSTRELSFNPEKYPPDKYKKKNDGSFRSYEVHRHRIAYQITLGEIIILGVRSVRMDPKKY